MAIIPLAGLFAVTNFCERSPVRYYTSNSDAPCTQVNPAGECCALQKVLGSYHASLCSVLLYYSQLESSIGQHWPPALTHAQWLLLCKETEVTGALGGSWCFVRISKKWALSGLYHLK